MLKHERVGKENYGLRISRREVSCREVSRKEVSRKDAKEQSRNGYFFRMKFHPLPGGAAVSSDIEMYNRGGLIISRNGATPQRSISVILHPLPGGAAVSPDNEIFKRGGLIFYNGEIKINNR